MPSHQFFDESDNEELNFIIFFLQNIKFQTGKGDTFSEGQNMKIVFNGHSLPIFVSVFSIK